MSKEVFEPIIDGDQKFHFYDDHIETRLPFPDSYSYGIYAGYYHNIAISFDDKKYKRIYNSIKEKFSGKFRYWEKSQSGIVIPDIYKIPPIDFSKWTKEELIKFIEASKVYEPDLRPTFDSTWFKVKYTDFPSQFYGLVDNQTKVFQCSNWQHGGRVVISESFEIDDFTNTVHNNRAFIRQYLEYMNCKYLHSIEVHNVKYTDELIVPNFTFKGVFKR